MRSIKELAFIKHGDVADILFWMQILSAKNKFNETLKSERGGGVVNNKCIMNCNSSIDCC